MKEYDFFYEATLATDGLSINKYAKSENFQIYCVKFIVELLLQDGFLLLPKFLIYREFVSNLFEFNIGEDIELREFLLKAIISFQKEEKIVSNIIFTAQSEQTTIESRNLLIDYALKALESCSIISQEYITAIDSLIISLGLSRSKYSKQLDYIDSNKEKISEQPSFNLLKNLNDSPLLQAVNQSTVAKTYTSQPNSKTSLMDNIKNVIPIGSSKHMTGFDLKTTKRTENEKTRRLIAGINGLNSMMNSSVLEEELRTFNEQLKDDNKRIVIAGEIKHGKSSLFNKILGQSISPEGESTATTATTIELFYSPKPIYEIKWMSEDNINRALEYIKANESNSHISDFKYDFEEILSKEYFIPDSIFRGVRSNTDLPKYLCSNGEFAPAVEKVRIGSPIQCLKHGAILVDTPGLNDPMKIRDGITLNQANLADTLIFVMRADKFGLESERVFLEEIVRNGKISELIIVVTHIDLIKDKSTAKGIKEDVKEWLKKVPTKASPPHMQALMYEASIFVLDARTRFDVKGSKGTQESEFTDFIEKLSNINDSSSVTQKYVDWVKNKRLTITGLANTEMNHFLKLGEDSKFNNLLMGTLRDIILQLEALSDGYEKQVSARLDLIQKKHYNDFLTLRHASEKYFEITKDELAGAIKEKTYELDKNYSNKQKWKSFNDDIAKGIVSKNVLALENEAQRIFESWPVAIEDFYKNLAEDFEQAFSLFPEIRGQYEDIAKTPAFIFCMCKAGDVFHTLDKGIKKTVILASGAAAAIAFIPILGPGVLVSAAVGLGASKIAIIAGVTGAYMAVKSAFDQDGAKESFISDKIKRANIEVEKQFEQFDSAIYDEFSKIEALLLENSIRLYTPILSLSLASGRELSYQIQVAEKMQKDTRKYADLVLSSSNE